MFLVCAERELTTHTYIHTITYAIQAHPPLALALLNVSFFSVWTALCPQYPHGDDGSVDAYPLIAPLEGQCSAWGS